MPYTNARPDHLAEHSSISRRAIVRTGAWSVPVVAVAVNAPAFAASTSRISGAHELERYDRGVSSNGSVTNDTPTEQTVTFDWLWMCDSTGPGAGNVTQFSADNRFTGWTLVSAGFVAGAGDPNRGVRLVARRAIGAGATADLPPALVTMAATVTGTVSLTLSTMSSAIVVQPDDLRWPAYIEEAASPRMRKMSDPAPGIISLRS